MNADNGREQASDVWSNWFVSALGLSCVPGSEGGNVCCTCDEDVGLPPRNTALPPQKGAYAVHTFSRPWETPGMPDYVPPGNSATEGGPKSIEVDNEQAKLIAAEREQRAKAAWEKASQDVRDTLKEVSVRARRPVDQQLQTAC